MKIGRNQKCPCGSGKKYKKCCIDMDRDSEIGDRVPQEVKDYFEHLKAEDITKKKTGLYIDFVDPIIFQGKRVWALGNKVYPNRPPGETFHNFIIYILMATLGKEWWDGQENLSDDKIHFIAKVYKEYVSFVKKNCPKKTENGGRWIAVPDGWTRLLMALAYDVASIIHRGCGISESILNRLRDKNEYQGARYEIMIAGIFARLGYKLEFLEDNSKKHCEFVATHPSSDVSIAVEVKSRHRAGVIHMPGDKDEEKINRGDVITFFKKAVEQQPGDKPFMIFIDINSPQTPTIPLERKRWFKDIEKRLRGIYLKPNPTNPEPFNALFFTNHSFHYQENSDAIPGEYFGISAQFPQFPLPNDNYIFAIGQALKHYGNVPNIDLKQGVEDFVKRTQ